MAFLLSCDAVRKSFQSRPLFKDITLGVDENDRVGLIGPNGSGKSTLLKLFAGLEKPDSGTVSGRRGLRIGYVAQEDGFPANLTVRQVLYAALEPAGMDDMERDMLVDLMIDRMEFPDDHQLAADLSGGWRKRLAIARAMIAEPDLLLLDEPTNHLDLSGVLWLENLLRSELAPGQAFIVVTHDRYFLENVATRIVELNGVYADGYLNVVGTYSTFLEKRAGYLLAQERQQDALQTQVRREIEWLRRGAKARTTKAKGRIDAAGRLIDDLAEVKFRNKQLDAGVSDIDFSSSGRQTRQLLTAKIVSVSIGGRTLLTGLDLVLSPKRRIGLIGANGSGKTTLLRTLIGELEPSAGVIKRAEGLRIVWFDQNRAHMDRNQTLRDALCPDGDTVFYGEQTMHVTGWAKRFGFRTEQLSGKISYLSGGEQARVLLAQLMLRPADLLILDEPTNDLDIPSLEALEQSLVDFAGAVLLVTHDRYLLDAVSTEILALSGDGAPPRSFADFAQWETVMAEEQRLATAPPQAAPRPVAAPVASPALPALSAAERKELGGIEDRIHAAEARVAEIEQKMVHPANATHAERLAELWNALPVAQADVARLYARWEELDSRKR